ncbi:MAG: ADP-ribosylglycohydrolase family protein [Vallitaleaceae bacterium]|nr:ADP-ribosylglycohydrolase family protein [Vallitaleaceae bacterium]
MVNTRKKGLIYGAFIADALALGPHWIYDTTIIEQQFKPLRDFQKPYTPYHPNKEAGDFTHYGDQAFLLLEHISSVQAFDVKRFKEEWLQLMNTGKLYLDHATKDSIQKFSEVDCLIGSDSLELGGLVRCAPLFAQTHTSLEDILCQTHLTHNQPLLDEIAEFTFVLLNDLLKGVKPSESIHHLSQVSSQTLQALILKAKSLLDVAPIEAIKEIGQSCSSEYSFPAALYLILKYEDHFEEALIQNAYAGGDSAARGMYVGMVLGAYHGFDALPIRWINGLRYKERIDTLIHRF